MAIKGARGPSEIRNLWSICSDQRDLIKLELSSQDRLFRYANMFTEISGANSTQILATDIRQALDNPAVKAIVLNIDSPEGVAGGINELADMIYAGRSQKRIVAYVCGTCASAAY